MEDQDTVRINRVLIEALCAELIREKPSMRQTLSNTAVINSRLDADRARIPFPNCRKLTVATHLPRLNIVLESLEVNTGIPVLF